MGVWEFDFSITHASSDIIAIHGMMHNKKIPRTSRGSTPETMARASGRDVVTKPEKQSSPRSNSGVSFTDTDLIVLGYQALVMMMVRDPKRWRLERRAGRMLNRLLTERGLQQADREKIVDIALHQWQNTKGWRGECKAHPAQR